jgi:hypothetical protein
MSTSIHIPTASSSLTTTLVSVSLTNATLAVVISGGVTGTPAVLPIAWQLNDSELV